MPTVSTANLQDEVLTGEAVALDLQPLGLVARAVGAAIDVFLMALEFLAIAMLLQWLTNEGILDEQTFRMALIMALALIAVVIPTAVETLSHGRSVGKLVMGGRIVRADGGTIGFRHSFLRALVGVVEIVMTFGTMALLVGIFTPRAQRLGDLAAGTYCERVRAPKVPSAHIMLPPQLNEWALVADVSRMPDRLSRKLWQFCHESAVIDPAFRHRLASDLLAEAWDYVHPMPPGDPVTAVTGIMVIRRDRELRALQARNWLFAVEGVVEGRRLVRG